MAHRCIGRVSPARAKGKRIGPSSPFPNSITLCGCWRHSSIAEVAINNYLLHHSGAISPAFEKLLQELLPVVVRRASPQEPKRLHQH